MATATVSIAVTPPQEMTRLRAEMRKRGIAPYRVAKELDTLKSNPDRIYQILRGTRPAPVDFLDAVCGLTGIPLKAVLSPAEYEVRHQALRDEMHVEDADRMGR